MNQNELNNNIAVASMRLAAIQPAFNNTYPDMTKKAYYDRISKQPFKFPDGHEVLYSPGQQIEAIIVICKFERLNEYFTVRRNRSGEMVEFCNVNTNVNHEVVPPFHKV